MNPPRLFKSNKRGKTQYSYSCCVACEKWYQNTMIFHHEGSHWVLCKNDYEEYWLNTDVLQEDYKEY